MAEQGCELGDVGQWRRRACPGRMGVATRRMAIKPIARQTLAFFFVTSLANVASLIAFAFLYTSGIQHHDRNPTLTYGSEPPLLSPPASSLSGYRGCGRQPAHAGPGAGRIAQGAWFVRNSPDQGVCDALAILRSRPVGIVPARWTRWRLTSRYSAARRSSRNSVACMPPRTAMSTACGGCVLARMMGPLAVRRLHPISVIVVLVPRSAGVALAGMSGCRGARPPGSPAPRGANGCAGTPTAPSRRSFRATSDEPRLLAGLHSIETLNPEACLRGRSLRHALRGMDGEPPLVLSSGRRLLGRDHERGALDRLVDGARRGRGGVLVIHGEPGVGKSALLEYAEGARPDVRIARTIGVEAEMELPFVAIQQLCVPFLELMVRLPRPQRDALGVAFGLTTGPAPDRFLVGLAVLGLLAEAAEDQPLVCTVDDAQWLDSASAQILAFVARRLLAERVALLFATRQLGEALADLPELCVEPLGLRDARALLDSALPVPLDEAVIERIVAETRGNPLALLELPRGLSPTQLAGGFGLPQALPVSAGVEENFLRRLAGLPQDARRLLLLAAAEPVGDPALVWRAAVTFGIPETAARVLESEGLLVLSPRVAFRHPLVRSAVYGSADPDERHEIHQALAEATDRDSDPDRRAWHLAQATFVPDEDVADELDQSAARAQARGGFGAAAAFLERAVALTPDPSRRAQRALDAAQATFRAGALDDALHLLETAESSKADDGPVRAHVHLLRAQIAFAARRGSDATPLLLAAARELEPIDPDLARATYLEALSAAMFAGRLARGAGMVKAGEAALAGPPMPAAPRPSDLLLQGFAVQATRGYAAGAPILKEALSAFLREPLLPPDEARWLWFASWIALVMWDDASWSVLSTRQLELLRRTGDLSALPFVLVDRTSVFAFFGDLRAAELLEEETRAAGEATGIATSASGRLSLAALRGGEAEFAELVLSTIAEARARGEGVALTVAEFLSGTLYNGLGRYEAALAAVTPAERFYSEGPAIWALTELIEAAVRCGQPERAQRAFERVEETTRAAGTEWALGIEARMRALLSDGSDAEGLYQEAITRLGRTSIRVQLARTHLLYGEWLRRRRRRLDAREELRTAHALFTDFGVKAFAERAGRELEATGERARKRTVDAVDQLTPQESRIARLAAEGHSNREIAARLFISANTVEYHLRKVFRKLDVKSRTQLEAQLS
jgi:DNA-binding CsgD family transcriptional regulator